MWNRERKCLSLTVVVVRVCDGGLAVFTGLWGLKRFWIYVGKSTCRPKELNSIGYILTWHTTPPCGHIMQVVTRAIFLCYFISFFCFKIVLLIKSLITVMFVCVQFFVLFRFLWPAVRSGLEWSHWGHSYCRHQKVPVWKEILQSLVTLQCSFVNVCGSHRVASSITF